MDAASTHRQDDPLATLRDIVARARGTVQWVQLHLDRAVETGELSPEDAEEIFDHADEADAILLGPLDLLHPELKSLTDEAGAAEYERLAADVPLPAEEPQGIAVIPVLRSVLEETRILLAERAPVALASLGTCHRLGPEEMEQLHTELDEAREAVEAALVALDPERLSREIASLRDPDERIGRASEHEHEELRRHVVRQTNDFWRKAK